MNTTAPHRQTASARELANAIRFLAIDAVQHAKSGHPGMPMGMADVATVLFQDFLKFDPTEPEWADRDRFVLSAGHGSMLLYALLYLTGYDGITIDNIRNFRQLHSPAAGHPEHGYAGGIETTTGPLGQGLANAVGMAIAERRQAALFGAELVDHRTYVIASDGDLMEGISHEAASLAGHLKLSKLIVLYDDNNISIDGDTGLSLSDDALKRFESYGWATTRIDGHDEAQIHTAISQAQLSDRPSLIACRTTIGFGSPNKAGKSSSHGAPLGEDEVQATRQQLGWDCPPFDVPADVTHEWRSIGQRGALQRLQWQQRYENSPQKAIFDQSISNDLPEGWDDDLKELIQTWAVEQPAKATRQLSQSVLNAIAPKLDKLVGGSADLTGSNNTKAEIQAPISSEDFAGSYMYYGVREHAMASIMNGMVLHRGIIPYGGTFLVFSDYLRPALRLAALMKQRVIHVLTHDSIGLGEDGPTHQPVEHLAALRAMPNVLVFRPADALEVAESWQLALTHKDSPSVIALTRQVIRPVRCDSGTENLTSKGAYIVYGQADERDVTILATGSEVGLAVTAAEKLGEQGIRAAVVSMPCWELFEKQDKGYQEQVLGSVPRIAVEAACCMGWDRYIGANGKFIGMTGFGASAPADQLYEHFGITADNIIASARELCAGK